MKMKELKQEVYESWKDLSAFNRALVQPEHFKPEVRKFGDLRYKKTWEAAYCTFTGRNMMDSCLDAFTLITIQFNPEWWQEGLRHLLMPTLDEFLKLPEGLKAIKQAFEQLVGDYTTSRDKENAHGFFRLVQEEGRADRGGAGRLPDGLAGLLQSAQN